MHVIATAGHVDHGKSTLVRALTGMEPDRWAEERRRGMTIDLGFAWTTLPSKAELAIVDVPGHERFTTNMLAGVGPVPAILLVVAADGGWSAQTAEHVAALDALGVRLAVVAVTRCDLADPAPVMADVAERLASTTLGAPPAIAVSAPTGAGLDELRGALDDLVAGLPAPDPDARIRLWVDRVFTVRGFGTVVTGTLGAGRIAVGDVLHVGGEPVVVRGLEQLGRRSETVEAVARVAVNLRAGPADGIRRGDTLVTPAAWHHTTVVDVRLTRPAEDLPRQMVLHIGSVAAPVRVRPLGPAHARLTLGAALPLEIGDRALLRDPGLRLIRTGVVVLDPAPPTLSARGAGARRRVALESATADADAGVEVDRRQVVERSLLTQLGVPAGGPPAGAVEVAGWVVAEGVWQRWTNELRGLVDEDGQGRLVRDGVGQAEAGRRLGLPDNTLLGAVADAAGNLELAGGRVKDRRRVLEVDPSLAAALAPVLARFATSPFDAPVANDLVSAGLDDRRLAAGAAAGLILVLPGRVVLPPDAAARAGRIVAALPQPFTLSQARQALGTSRRVAVPLLEHLDREGLTRRVAGDLRQSRSAGAGRGA